MIHVGVALIIHHLGRKSVPVLQGDVKQRWLTGDREARSTLLCTMNFPFVALLKNLPDSISVLLCSTYVLNIYHLILNLGKLAHISSTKSDRKTTQLLKP